jgi:hypothetical protein
MVRKRADFERMPLGAIRRCLNVLIQLERRPGKRFIAEVLESRGYNSESDRYDFFSVFAAQLPT